MLSTYSTPIITAVIVLFIIGFFTAVPWVIHNYRRFGFLSFWTTVVMVSFIFYALAAYFLVILPLPEVRDTCAMQSAGTQNYQLVPFYFLYEIFQGSHIVFSQPSTYIQFFRHGSFLPAFMNVLILLPLGVFMKYFRKHTMTIKRMFVLGFSVSLFFEITQLTGLYGIYTCPYRMFNVDDLLLNTLGAVIGFLIAPLLLALFPSQEQVLEKSDRVFKAGVVPALPQFIAIMIDYIVVIISWLIASSLFNVYDPVVQSFFIAIGMFVLQFLLPLATKGSTLGSKVLRFRLNKGESTKMWGIALLQRWFALMAPWFAFTLLSIVSRVSTLDMDAAYYRFHVWIQVLMLLLMLVIIFIGCLHVLVVVLRKKRHRFYFDEIAGIVSRYNHTKHKK